MEVLEREGAEGRRPRLTASERAWIGRRARMALKSDRHGARRMAEAYGISASWVRTQRRREERHVVPRPCGRPRTPLCERERVKGLVLDQFLIQGTVGWRDVLAGIRRIEAGREKPTSTMLVQQETAALKREVRSNLRRALEETRRGHEVLARDAVWAQDATHVGRLPDKSRLEAEVATDRASTSTVIAAVGPPASATDLRALLERAKAERGTLPHVWQSDRGSANTSQLLADYFAASQMIHLCSRVHLPQDNPVAENKNRELKKESRLGKGVALSSPEEARAHLAPARRRLDEGRLRASRGFRTAAELDRELPRAQDLVPREQFYAEACSAKEVAALGLSDPRAIQKAQQDAIWRTLEKHGLARPHVGLRRTPCPRLAPVAPIANR